jgi:alkyldihydroxyacetonephosphate synthase
VIQARRPSPAPVPLAGAHPGLRIDAHRVELDEALVSRLRGACRHVDTDQDSCLEASRDWWPLALTWATAGQAPGRASAVARPGTADEVAAVVRVCAEAAIPVTPVAGRSGVCGASVPVFGGVALDLCDLAGIDDVDDASLLVKVSAGTFGDDLEAALRADHRLTLGHWPQSVELSTVGGWVACRSAGQYSTRYGKIEDMVVGLDVVMADGRRVVTGGLAPRSASGPDLTQLFVGSEGTLGVVTSALLRAHPSPPAEQRAAYAFADFASGLDACRRILRRGATPAVLRLYDPTESARSFDVTDAAVLVVLDEGDQRLLDATMAVVGEECGSADGLADDLVARWLGHRNDVSALGSLVSRGLVVDTIEIAARWSVLGGLYSEVVKTLGDMPQTLAASAHQSHAYGDGACLYFTFAARPPEGADPGWAEGYYLRAWDAVMDATIRAGGAISHHHGIGLNRARHLVTSMGDSHQLLAALKQAFDPQGILNPGKLGLSSPFGDTPWP